MYFQRKSTGQSYRQRRTTRNDQPLPHLNAFVHCTDESILYIKEDIDTIIVSLQTATLSDLDSIKRSRSLLETLSSYLISNKSNHSFKFSINFLEQILSLDKLLQIINSTLKTEVDKPTKSLLYHLQNLTLKNIRNLLKITSGHKDDAYAVLLENLLNTLIQIKELIANTDRESDFETAIQLESVACTLLKCIFFLSSKCEFNIQEINKTSLCGRYIGILRCFAFYGLDNYDLKTMTVELYPSPISQFFSSDSSESSMPKKKKGKLDEFDLLEDDSLFNTTSVSFSTSEYSSSELDEESIRMTRREVQHNKKIYGKMRMLAYESLQSSLSIFGIRHVFGFWSFLFPDEPKLAENTQFSVLLTIAKDTSNRVRTSALNFMYNFFNFGKLFIRTLVNESAFSKPTSTKAFTPLSVSLTSMVKKLHTFFEHILLKESNSAILILIYKVISLIVVITPYNKLSTDILHPLFYRNSFFLDHKVTQIKNLSLVLYVKMFSPEFLSRPFRQWLVESKTGLEVTSKVFKCCFENIENPDYILLCIESVKLLSAFVKHHGLMVDLFNSEGAVGVSIESVSKVSIDTIQNERSLTNPVLQSFICKFIHSLSMLFKHICSKEVNSDSAESSSKLQFIKGWFLQVFSSRLFQLALVDLDMSLVKGATQVTLINVISLIPESVFALIELNTHYHIITVLMSLARGEFSEMTPDEQEELSIYTKSAAIRCLSIIQSFACLSDDLSLTFDLIGICLDVLEKNDSRSKTQKKKEIFLLEHSSWALANICDAIKKNHLEMEVDLPLLNRIVSCLLTCYDINRIQYHTDDILVNLARCSGITLYIVLYRRSMSTAEHDEADEKRKASAPDETAVFEIVKRLIGLLLTKRLYKLQWNICIALSYLLSLEVFVDSCRAHCTETGEETLLQQVYGALLHMYTSTPNHKVQSYSVFTICSVANLSSLQLAQLEQLWPCVVDKFIADFDIVPVHSQQSWLEKYVFALQRLLEAFVLPQGHQMSEKTKDELHQLRTFVATQTSHETATTAEEDGNNLTLQLLKLQQVLQQTDVYF